MRKDVLATILNYYPKDSLGIPKLCLKHINVCVHFKNPPPTYFMIVLKHRTSEFTSRKKLNKIIFGESKKYHFPRRLKKFGIKDIENTVKAAINIDNKIEYLIKMKKLKENIKKLESDFS